MHWRRKWQPTPVFLPGESQGWQSLVGCHLWDRTESDTTEVTWHLAARNWLSHLSMGFSGENTGVEYHSLLQGIFPTQGSNPISYISCTGRWILATRTTCTFDYAKAFDCVDHNKLYKILQEMGIPDHLTCLLRNLYAGQETTVRTGYGTTDLFQIGKGECQGCILSSCLFNFYAEYIMRSARLVEAQAGIKITGRNINTSDMQMTPLLWQKVKRN